MTLLQRVFREKRRVIAPLALFAIANVVLYAVVVFPLSHQVVSAEAEAREQHQQLNAARLDLKNARATVAGKTQADVNLQKFYKDVLPGDQAVARRLTYTRLAELAHEANVTLEHAVNSVAPVKGSTLSKLTTTYSLSGEYRNVRKFIYSLETAPEFIVLENVGLTSGGEQQPNRSLAVNLVIATYFRSGNDGQQ
jgi:type IV pilus assembly protein PilO